MASILLKIALLLFVAYIFFCLALFLRQDSLLFQPCKWRGDLPTPRDEGLDYEDGFFPSGAEKINYWFIKNPSAKKVILFFHGNAGNISDRIDLARVLYDEGFSVFLFDYRE